MSKATNGAKATEFQFYAPKEKQTLGQFFHNSKDGTYFGRTPKSWGQLMTFYIIFYIVLAALFTICLQGLFASLHDNEPKWKLEESLIGTNPGLGFRPLSEETERGSLIQFNAKNGTETKYWIDLLNDYMKDYTYNQNVGKHCTFNESHSNDVCQVNIQDFGSCSPQNGYGYNISRPCVFLKLNKIFNWMPHYYDDPVEVANLPDMPLQLKAHIKETNPLERQQIWVSCDGTNSHDKEKLGKVSYYPTQGFPAYYYPFVNQRGYLSPLIALQFENLAANEMINIECRAWAKNIIYSGSIRDRMGSVTFQIQMDEDKH